MAYIGKFLLGPFILWVPQFVVIVLFLTVLAKYLRPHILPQINYRILFWLAITFRFLFAIYETIAQRLIWQETLLTLFLLTLPLEGGKFLPLFSKIFSWKGGYFAFYSTYHFWLNPVLALFAAWLFYRFLLILKKHKESFFEEGEPQLGFLLALLAGWPGVIIFVILSGILVVLFSVIRGLRGNDHTTLGPSFFFATALVLLFNPYFSMLFGTGVLRV